MPKGQKKPEHARKEIEVNPHYVACRALPETVNEESRTVEVEYVTETSEVMRYDWISEQYYYEVLSTNPEHVRLEKLNDSAPVLDSHSRWSVKDHVLGVVDRADSKTATLRFGTDESSEIVFRKIKEGIITKVSVGYRVFELEKDGEKDDYPIYRAIDWEPFEISLVAVPADQDAKIRSKGEETPSKNKCVLLTPSTATRGETPTQRKETPMPDNIKEAEKTRAEDIKTPEVQQPATPALTQNDVERAKEEAREEEKQRCADIREIVEKFDALDEDFEREMINGNHSVEAVRKLALDKMIEANEQAPTQGRISVKMGEDIGRQNLHRGIADMLCYRAAPSQFKLDENAQRFHGLSLMDLAREFVPNAQRMPAMKIAERAMHTSSDMPLVLMDAMNKMVTTQYDVSQERTHTRWARRKTANDFKDMHHITTDGDFKLEEVNEHGEYKSTTLTESSEKYRISKFGKKIKFTIEMLINDDMSVFDDILPGFVAGAVDTEREVVYNILSSNPNMSDGKALFHTDHDNLITNAFDIAGLDAMGQKIRKQKSLSGKNLLLGMDFVIIGFENENLADRILTGDYDPATVSDVNPYGPKGRKKVDIIYEPLISDINDKTWFAGSHNPRAKHISYALLNGYESPEIKRVESQDPDGFTAVARHFFGAGIDDKYIMKSSGTT